MSFVENLLLKTRHIARSIVLKRSNIQVSIVFRDLVVLFRHDDEEKDENRIREWDMNGNILLTFNDRDIKRDREWTKNTTSIWSKNLSWTRWGFCVASMAGAERLAPTILAYRSPPEIIQLSLGEIETLKGELDKHRQMWKYISIRKRLKWIK